MALGACFGAIVFKSNLRTIYWREMIRRRWWNPADFIGAASETWRRECKPSSGLHRWLPWCCNVLCSLLKEWAPSRLLFWDRCKNDHTQSQPVIGINGNTTAFFNLVCLCNIRFLRDNPPNICLTKGSARHSLVILVSYTFPIIFDAVIHMQINRFENLGNQPIKMSHIFRMTF